VVALLALRVQSFEEVRRVRFTKRSSLIAEVAARRLGSSPRTQPVFLDPTFPVQSAFIADQAKLKVVLCTRRSGKSYGAGLYLYREAFQTPGASCLYIALTRDSSEIRLAASTRLNS
jgi:hypothetical protein